MRSSQMLGGQICVDPCCADVPRRRMWLGAWAAPGSHACLRFPSAFIHSALTRLFRCVGVHLWDAEVHATPAPGPSAAQFSPCAASPSGTQPQLLTRRRQLIRQLTEHRLAPGGKHLLAEHLREAGYDTSLPAVLKARRSAACLSAWQEQAASP